MTWLNPAAALAIVLVAAPVLIHLLIHRHAERFGFPTLRFIRPTRLAAIRRHVVEDWLLLAVRVAIVAAAVAAVAGPLVIGAARRAQWNARVARAIVIQEVPGNDRAIVGGDAAFRRQEFRSPALADAIHRAIRWLDDAPPARRELVIAGPLAAGSIRDADITAVPADIGIRFERVGALPSERRVGAVPLLTPAGTAQRTVTLDGPVSVVGGVVDRTPVNWPIEIVASAAQRPAVDAAVQAVLSQQVRKPASDRPVKLLLLDAANGLPGDLRGEEIRTAWMADAAARIARDIEVRDEAARQAAGFTDPRLGAAPWLPVATAATGDAVVSASAADGTLIVVSAAPANALLTPLLLRSMANSIAPVDDPVAAEIVPIADRVLRAWTRPPGPVTQPRVDTVERDDRRWLWITALVLLGVETVMRRRRRKDADIVTAEESRVA